MNGHTASRVKPGKAPPLLNNNLDESEAKTDHKRWRLLDERGRQRWVYLHTKQEAEEWPQSPADRYHLGMSVVSKSAFCA